MSKGIDRSAYLGAFREEMEEHLQALTEGLLSLESRPDDASSMGDVFRRAHTIKGSARMMGFSGVADLAHSMEDVLDGLRSGRLHPSAPLLDAMLAAVDLLRELVKGAPEDIGDRPDVQAVMRWLADLRGPQGEDPSRQAEGASGKPGEIQRPETAARETVRVDVQRIDNVLNLAGELTVLEAGRKQWSEEIAQFLELLDTVQTSVRAGDLKEVDGQIQRLSSVASQANKRYRRLVSQESEIVRELHYQVSTLRMLPVRAIFSLVPRAARDLAREEGKEVEVILEGEDTEVDREVLERVRDPVLHLVRNAVDHGIEPTGMRAIGGKPRVGKLRVAAYSRGEQAILEVEDDGAGVDFAAVREIAVQKGILNGAEAESLDEKELARLLFLPGFSTSSVVSDASGRGVGLDVVKSEVDALKGRVSLESKRGEGTKITLEMPITLAFTHVLLLEVGQATYGLACSSTQGVAEVSLEAVRALQAREVIELGDRTVPLAWLHRVLGVEPRVSREVTRWPAVVVGPSERPTAFVVDRVVGDENVIVKPLGPLLRRVPNVSGGIILGDGRVALLLSTSSLAEATRGVTGAAPEAPPRVLRRTLRVLVVDDSAITRELERGILESAGYRVDTAVDGQDALVKLKSHQFALVMADVDMPRLDGFQLAAAIRADRKLAHLPMVIVSARENDADRLRGLEIGVQAYVGKGSFDQDTLLDTIEGLIG